MCASLFVLFDKTGVRGKIKVFCKITEKMKLQGWKRRGIGR
jgi:hypothetical protein